MMTAGYVIAGISGLGILIVGVLYLVIPQQMARHFGFNEVPSGDATPWLRLKGIRDFATGVVALALIIAAPPEVLLIALLAFIIIPVGDAVMILMQRGRLAAALGIHGATAVLMLVGVVMLLLGQ